MLLMNVAGQTTEPSGRRTKTLIASNLMTVTRRETSIAPGASSGKTYSPWCRRSMRTVGSRKSGTSATLKDASEFSSSASMESQAWLIGTVSKSFSGSGVGV
eukprot:6481804-Amphidinium_carterae.1